VVGAPAVGWKIKMYRKFKKQLKDNHNIWNWTILRYWK
jgi:hypothetical protein